MISQCVRQHPQKYIIGGPCQTSYFIEVTVYFLSHFWIQTIKYQVFLLVSLVSFTLVQSIGVLESHRCRPIILDRK